MTNVVELWRYPIKAHGYEAVNAILLEANKTLAWDRHWAVIHEASKADGSVWAHCSNFTRGAKVPELMGIQAELNEKTEQITLHHPKLNSITFKPKEEGDRFIEWITPIMPENRVQPVKLVRSETQGMTDAPFPSISILSRNSLQKLSEVAGQPLSTKRFRSNIWIDGIEPWEEFDWIGKTISVGHAELRVVDRIERCQAINANPDTGSRDVDLLAVLDETWGHQNFGVYARAVSTGHVAIGDQVRLI